MKETEFSSYLMVTELNSVARSSGGGNLNLVGKFDQNPLFQTQNSKICFFFRFLTYLKDF